MGSVTCATWPLGLELIEELLVNLGRVGDLLEELSLG